MNEHWYLRHGDFRPEKLQPGETLGYPNAQITLEQLSEAGNLFDSEDDAIEASILVRSHLARFKFIRQERQEHNRLTGKHPDGNQPSSPSCEHQESADVKSQWYSVDDELPDKDQRVLCLMKSNSAIVSGYIVKNMLGEYIVTTDPSFDFTDYSYECTHWMAIPELPTIRMQLRKAILEPSMLTQEQKEFIMEEWRSTRWSPSHTPFDYGRFKTLVSLFGSEFFLKEGVDPKFNKYCYRLH